jgi:hypothetical protein
MTIAFDQNRRGVGGSSSRSAGSSLMSSLVARLSPVRGCVPSQSRCPVPVPLSLPSPGVPVPVPASRPSPGVPSQSRCPVPVPVSRPSPSVPSQSQCPVPVPVSRPSPGVPSQSQCPVPVPVSRPSPGVPPQSRCPVPSGLSIPKWVAGGEPSSVRPQREKNILHLRRKSFESEAGWRNR